jgi:hypothetical protein
VGTRDWGSVLLLLLLRVLLLLLLLLGGILMLLLHVERVLLLLLTLASIAGWAKQGRAAWPRGRRPSSRGRRAEQATHWARYHWALVGAGVTL